MRDEVNRLGSDLVKSVGMVACGYLKVLCQGNAINIVNKTLS